MTPVNPGRRRLVIGGAALAAAPFVAGCASPSAASSRVLASWNEGTTKQSITDFVASVTSTGSPGYVAPAERIACFDNDGTLWSEQTLYFQLVFAIERVKALAPRHPEWKTQQPFKAVLEGDLHTVMAGGEKALLQILEVSHSGLSTDDYAASVSQWLSVAKHPRFNRPYTDLVYQPMLELLGYLRANGFKTYIVSGGGIDFMRVFSERVYGIPPEQVVGSYGDTRFQLGPNGKPVLMKEPKVDFIDDGPGKPVAINRFIGRRPLFTFGNSDGDQQMLQWTAAGSGPRFMGLVHHTDGVREWAYDRNSPIGKLDKALDEAVQRQWTVVDMKTDWRVIYPFEKS